MRARHAGQNVRSDIRRVAFAAQRRAGNDRDAQSGQAGAPARIARQIVQSCAFEFKHIASAAELRAMHGLNSAPVLNPPARIQGCRGADARQSEESRRGAGKTAGRRYRIARARHTGARQAARARAAFRRCSTRTRHGSSSRRSPRWRCTTNAVPAAGIVTGIGRVRGRELHDHRQRCDGQRRHILSDDGEKASARAGDRAENRLPCIYLVDSGGAHPAEPGRGVSRSRSFRPHLLQPGEHVGPVLRRSPSSWARARPAALTCPRCRDETVIVKDQGTIFLAGPPLVKAATGEDRQRRRARRRATCTRGSPASPTISRENDGMHSKSRARIVGASGNRRSAVARERASRATRSTIRRGNLRRHAARPAHAVRRARNHCAHRRRQRASTSSRRATAPRSSAGSRTSKGIRSASSRTTASCSPNRR